MDQLREYRLKMMEKRLLQQQQQQQSTTTTTTTTSVSSNVQSKSPPRTQQQQHPDITAPITKGDLRAEYGQGKNNSRPPGDWFKPSIDQHQQQQEEQVSATLKIKSKTIDEEVHDRSEKLTKMSEVLNPKTEKKKFKERLETYKEEELRREREEKKKAIELLREQVRTGKKQNPNSAPYAFTKHIDSKNAADIINRSPITPSTIRFNHDDQPDMIFAPTEDEPVTPTSTPCMVQIRMMEGIQLKAQFQSEDNLRVICEYIIQMANGSIKQQQQQQQQPSLFTEENYTQGIRISTTYPRRIFKLSELNSVNLKQAGLCPNGSVIVERDEDGFRLIEEPKYTYTMIERLRSDVPWRLKGDDFEEKQKFKERQRQEEIKRAQKEKLAKKKELERLRLQIAEDKKNRSK